MTSSGKNRCFFESVLFQCALACALAVIAMTVNPTAVAQEEGQELPTAEEVIDRFVEATGGVEAYEKIENREVHATLSMPAMQIEGKVVLFQAEPRKMKSTVTIEGIGETVEGTNGEVVWSSEAMSGPRVVTGAERAAKLREATFNKELHLKKLYEKMELKGVENIDGRESYKVVLTPPKGEGEPETHYYDKENHLLVKVVQTADSPMGKIPVETIVSDYKEVDGILYPYKATQRAMMQEFVIAIDEVKHNVELEEGLFDLPEEIQALVKKERSAEEEADLPEGKEKAE